MDPGIRVNRGGLEGPKGFLFELTGGALCLDLANTVDNRPTPRRREFLCHYSDLVAWGEQAGAITPKEARRLRREATRRPAEAEGVLQRALELREAIFAIFSELAAGRQAPKKALAAFEAELPGALARLHLVAGRRGFRWAWAEGDRALDRVLWPVLRSGADLLTSNDLGRVRECAAGTCGWLFLDRSRNRTRRWCDMSVCGNRDKARRYYMRMKAQG